MKIFWFTGVVCLATFFLQIQIQECAAAPVQVVASTLDMADFARQIGGERVQVEAILRGQFDPHFYEPRPSDVMKLNKADLLIVAGMELDAFMRGLIDAARNPRIRFGAPGFVDPSVGVEALDIPTEQITGAMGDVHPFGNPHFWYTPENVRIACENIAAGLIRVAPLDEDYFRARLESYLREVEDTFARLQEDMAPRRGTRVLQFHPSWDYFCKTFGLEIVGSIEPKPGIPPSAAHLRDLVDLIRREQVALILLEPFYSERPLRFLKTQTGIESLRLPLFLGGNPGTATYLENLEFLVSEIVKRLAS